MFTLQSDVSPLPGRISVIEGDYLRSSDLTALQSQADANTSDIAAVPGVLGTQVLNVPGVYADVQTALDSIAGSRIAPDAIVTIQVAPGLWPQASSVLITHPDARQIEIVGDIAAPQTTILQFAGTDGVVVTDNTHFGGLYGVTLQGDDADAAQRALTVENGSSVWLNAVDIDDFRGGAMHMASGSWVRSGPNPVRVLGCGTAFSPGAHGLRVTGGSSAELLGLEVTGCEDSVYANYSSYADVSYGIMTFAAQESVHAIHGSYIRVDYASVSFGAGTGVRASRFSGIEASATTCDNSGQYGFFADQMSWMDTLGSTASGSGIADFAPLGEGWSNSFLQ